MRDPDKKTCSSHFKVVFRLFVGRITLFGPPLSGTEKNAKLPARETPWSGHLG